jgi:hypothetical protein
MSVAYDEKIGQQTTSMLDATDAWAAQIVRESSPARCTSIGLTCGSRDATDRRVVDALTRSLSQQSSSSRRESRLLLLRLNVFHSTELDRQDDQPLGAPRPTTSPLGDWSEVTVPMPVGRRASWSLQNLPRWLPAWKSEYRMLVVDLGPMDLVPSRSIGRLCDSCFVVLGPDYCASHEWILEHVAWHDRSGNTICGTILVNQGRAA